VGSEGAALRAASAAPRALLEADGSWQAQAVRAQRGAGGAAHLMSSSSVWLGSLAQSLSASRCKLTADARRPVRPCASAAAAIERGSCAPPMRSAMSSPRRTVTSCSTTRLRDRARGEGAGGSGRRRRGQARSRTGRRRADQDRARARRAARDAHAHGVRQLDGEPPASPRRERRLERRGAG
jgi:hypothetical protein